MAKLEINIGSAANDGTGDDLRIAFGKVNDNFSELYTELGGSSLSNFAFAANTMSTENSNGDINFDPNGTGNVVVTSGNLLPASDSTIQNLGSSTDKWTNIYAAQMHVDSMVLTAINNTTIGNTVPSTGAFTTLTATTITGPLTGNVTGNITGNITGDVTGNVIGNVTGNVTGTAATVTVAAQTNITSVGTLTALAIDNISLNGNTISSDNINGDINFDPNGTGNVVVTSGNLLPASDSTLQNLGSSTDKWTNLYATQGHFDNIVIGGPTQSTVGSAGGASALPGAPSGYLRVNIGGTFYVLPFYAVS